MLDYVASRSETARNKKHRKIILYICCGALLLLIVGLFFFVRSGIFETKDVRIPDMHSVSQHDVYTRIETFFNSQSQITKWIFGKRNIFTFDQKEVSASLLDAFPSLQSVEIKKNVATRSLLLLVQEREKAGVWCIKDDSSCVWFDAQGIAFLDGLRVEGNLLYKVVDTTRNEIRLGDAVLPDYELKNLFRIYEFLGSVSWNTKKLLFDDQKLSELKTSPLEKDPTIYFSLTNDPTYAIESVREIKNKNLEYIDLRVEGRVYYK